MALVFPGIKIVLNEMEWSLAIWASHRSTCALGPVEDMEPRVVQLTANALSLPSHKES